MRKQHFNIFYLLGICLLIGISACKKDEETPPNPYDNVDYGDDGNNNPPPDPNSIVGIHQNILVQKCALPGCHDGNFEPDFRTVQSAYTTLVYHPIVKNMPDSSFTYRVVPNDTSESILIRRLSVDDAQLQRMPATGAFLSDGEMDNIINWINSGALDMFGQPGVLPNKEPLILGYLAFDSAFNRIDTIRVGGVGTNPIEVSNNMTVQFALLVEDDSTALNQLQVNQLKFSYDIDDFSSAQTYQAVFVSIGGFDIWLASVPTSNFIPGSTAYFRYYVNDGDHASPTEFPKDELYVGYKTYASMYILP